MIIAEFITIHGVPPYDLNFWPGGVDLSRWGNECKRGMPYQNRGTEVAGGGSPGHKISTGRKERGLASDDYDRQQARNG
jgi:hypothetical protein